VVDTESNRLDLKSLRSYGIHGAIGLLMGIGVGFILFFIISPLIAANYSIIIGAGGLVTALVIFGLYGLYVGYIFGGQKRSSRISIICAAAGVFGGLVTAGLLAVGFITMSGGYFEPLFVTLFFTGPILGFPKIKNMVLMTASSAFGAVMGYGVYSFGLNITAYLNSVGGALFALFIAILFPLLAIGIAGASIAIGMYFTEWAAFSPREIPGFLKITRNVGIVLTLIVLFFSASMFVSVANYANTEVSIFISSGDRNMTVFVPVLLENGNIMKIYEKPTISGSATTEIIYTDHGKAFKISGSGSTNIIMKQTSGTLATDPEANEKFVNGFTLSTSNATNYGDFRGLIDVWVYSEEDGTILSLSIKRDNGWGRDMRISTEREEKLTKGWQLINLSVGRMMYD
jgi:hypothetical protein